MSHHLDPAQVKCSRGPVLRRRNGASGLTSNAPFAAEVQSNIEQSCCSIIAKAGKNPVLGSEVQESRLFRTETEFVKLPVPLDIGSRRRSILMPRGRRPSTGLALRSRYVCSCADNGVGFYYMGLVIFPAAAP